MPSFLDRLSASQQGQATAIRSQTARIQNSALSSVLSGQKASFNQSNAIAKENRGAARATASSNAKADRKMWGEYGKKIVKAKANSHDNIEDYTLSVHYDQQSPEFHRNIEGATAGLAGTGTRAFVKRRDTSKPKVKQQLVSYTQM